MAQTPSIRRVVLLCERLEDRLVPDAKSFVTSLYQNLLNRAPDPSGLSFYLQEINNGASNQQIATEIWRSPEHRGIQVDGFYLTFLHRNADTSGRAHWVNELLSGNLNELGVTANFLTSAEYMTTRTTPLGFISGLYQDVLGRSPSTIEQLFWEDTLARMGSAAVTAGIITSPEAYTDALSADYLKYLNRSPDATGLDHYLNQLETSQATVETVAETILGSAEYAANH
jgi:hypothetical protein